MELPSGTYNETYVYRNIIDTISSSSASDVWKMQIEGHTVDDDLSVSSLTQAAGLAACTTSSNHGYSTGDYVYIEGANETEYNGIREITVAGDATFTFAVDSGATSPATGTITATKQNKTFVVQEATLDGQSKVVLGTPLSRVTLAFLKKQDAIEDVGLAGDVYVYEDGSITSGVPDTDSEVHLMVTGSNDNNNSLKASTSVSNNDYWIVTSIQGHLLEKAAAFADVALDFRELGGAWREIDKMSVDAGSEMLTFKPYVIIPKNADVRLRSRVNANDKYVGGSIEGYLANY